MNNKELIKIIKEEYQSIKLLYKEKKDITKKLKKLTENFNEQEEIDSSDFTTTIINSLNNSGLNRKLIQAYFNDNNIDIDNTYIVSPKNAIINVPQGIKQYARLSLYANNIDKLNRILIDMLLNGFKSMNNINQYAKDLILNCGLPIETILKNQKQVLSTIFGWVFAVIGHECMKHNSEVEGNKCASDFNGSNINETILRKHIRNILKN